MNIIEWIVENKIAQNTFQASANGLKLVELKDIATWQSFELAIAGIDPADVVERQIEMEMA